MLIVISLVWIPEAFAFYFSKYHSSNVYDVNVITDLEPAFVRASVITYWVDTTTAIEEINSDMTA